MNPKTIHPGILQGEIRAIPSKSAAHRLLICGALADGPTWVACDGVSQDIEATVRCLTALGAEIRREQGGYAITPIDRQRCEGRPAVLDCGESGSTLRFLLPVAAALGVSALFPMKGRLSKRPLFPLSRELDRHGCKLRYLPEREAWHIAGKLQGGDFTLPGNVSSQFFTGLLLALPLTGENSTLSVTGAMESAGYVEMTLQALQAFRVSIKAQETGWAISPQTYHSPGTVTVEGDWSNAAPWLCAGVIRGEGITVKGLNLHSAQGDRKIIEILSQMGGKVTAAGDAVTVRPAPLHGIEVDGRNIPDIIPVLAVTAALAEGTTRFHQVGRLRLKESDRLTATVNLLNALGGSAEVEGDTLLVHGRGQLAGGLAEGVGDHRMVMAAAVASVGCETPVTVSTPEAVAKSYPAFFEDFAILRGEGEP